MFFIRRSHFNSHQLMKRLLLSALHLLSTQSFDWCGYLDSPPLGRLTEVNESHSSGSAIRQTLVSAEL